MYELIISKTIKVTKNPYIRAKTPDTVWICSDHVEGRIVFHNIINEKNFPDIYATYLPILGNECKIVFLDNLKNLNWIRNEIMKNNSIESLERYEFYELE